MTGTRTFTLTWDQIDTIVVEELKDCLDRALTPERDEGGDYMDPDWDLIDALSLVIQYYMPSHEVESFKREVALQKLTTNDIVMGLYDEDCKTREE